MNTLKQFLNQIKTDFSITVQDAHEIMVNFHEEMRLGLAGEKSSLKMLPSFVSRPKGTEKGCFLAIDLGGTNIRVLSLILKGNGKIELQAVNRYTIPHETMTGTGDMFFDFIAECVQSFLREHTIEMQRTYDLGFTFSFPVEQSSIASGKLICWTKGFTASDVEGKDVVLMLTQAFQRKQIRFIHVSALVNDTVGTLAAKSYTDPACDVGVILGTGTNACYPEKIGRILKYKDSRHSGEMVINIEWGGFDKLHTNNYDQILDGTSQNPGAQRLEKMVSGMYLGEIARLIIVEMIKKGFLFSTEMLPSFSKAHTLTTEQLSALINGQDIFQDFGLTHNISADDKKTILEICRIVTTRSARIASTAIAAVITWMDPSLESNHTVAVDGSLFEKYPGFKDDMVKMLFDIFDDRAKQISLESSKGGSGIGAAIVAAVASLGRHKKS